MTSDTQFCDINDRSPVIPRKFYIKARNFALNESTDLAGLSLVDYIVCSTHRGGVCGIDLTAAQLQMVVDRLPVFALCAGYGLAKAVQPGLQLLLMELPTPLTLRHFDSLTTYLKNQSDKLQIKLTGINELRLSLELVHSLGLRTRYKDVVENGEYVLYDQTDHDAPTTFPMKDHTNEFILDQILGSWIKQQNLIPVPVVIDQGVHKVVVIDDKYVAPVVLYPSESKLVQDVRMNFRLYRDENLMDVSKDKLALACRLVNISAQIMIGKFVDLTKTQIKLHYMVTVLASYYGKSVKDFLKNALDLCSDPGNMSDYLAMMGCTVYRQTNNHISRPGFELVSPCLTVRPRLSIHPIGSSLSCWDYNITSSSDNHSYDLVVCDGYDAYGSTDAMVDLFWAQLYVALFKVKIGGTVIIKVMSLFEDLFVSEPAALGYHDYKLGYLGDDHLRRLNHSHNDRLAVFIRFAHWSLVKPVGSHFGSPETYLMFCGFRHQPTILAADYRVISHQYYMQLNTFVVHMDLLLKANCQSFIANRGLFDFINNTKASPSGVSVYIDVDPSKTIGSVVNAIPGLRQVDLIGYLPREMVMPVEAWRSKYTSSCTLCLSNGHEETITAPDTIVRVSSHADEFTMLIKFMHWAVSNVPVGKNPINWKAFALETLADVSPGSGFSPIFHKTGSDHSPDWKVSLSYPCRKPSETRVQLMLVNRLWVSGVYKSKKDAEQDAYRRVIEHLTSSVFITVRANTEIGPIITAYLDSKPNTPNSVIRAYVKSRGLSVTKREINHYLHNGPFVHSDHDGNKYWCNRPTPLN